MDAPDNETLLALDLSTSATGWAVFNTEDRSLRESGVIKGSTAGLSKLAPLHAKLRKMSRMADQVRVLAENFKVNTIVIEEITGSRNRLGQKTLDAYHHAVLEALYVWVVADLVFFQDVGGTSGWRPELGIRLSRDDKKHNRKARLYNSSRATRELKKHVVGWKDLSVEYVNEHFDLKLDLTEHKTSGDEADAICVGWAWMQRNLLNYQQKPGIIKK